MTLRIFKQIQAGSIPPLLFSMCSHEQLFGWKVSTRISTDMVLDALEQALHD